MNNFQLILFFAGLLSTSLGAQDRAYWAETSPLDSLVLIVNGHRRQLTAEDVNHTQYLFRFTGGGAAGLILYCAACEEPPSIKLWGKQEDAYTRWIYLKSGEAIGLDRAFGDHPEKSSLRRALTALKNTFLSFWESAKVGRSARRLTPALRSSGTPAPLEPKLAFRETDGAHYMNLQDFSLHFRLQRGFSIFGMYIISHDGRELLFCSGDPAVTGGVFPLDLQAVPPLENVLSPIPSAAGQPGYRLDYAHIVPYLLSSPRPRTWYQLGIVLRGDDYVGGSYLFNFQFLPPTQEKRIKQFLGIHD